MSDEKNAPEVEISEVIPAEATETGPDNTELGDAANGDDLDAAIGQVSGEIEAHEPVLSVEELSAQLAQAEQKAQDSWDKFLRTQAEMENLRRRTEKDVQNAHKFALEKFARELLSVMDSLELGIQAANNEGADAAQLLEGSELTQKQLTRVFEKFSLNCIDPAGQPFDPELHQAVSTQTDGSVAPDTVVQVFQKGYLLNDRLLRPAMVVVSQA